MDLKYGEEQSASNQIYRKRRTILVLQYSDFMGERTPPNVTVFYKAIVANLSSSEQMWVK